MANAEMFFVIPAEDKVTKSANGWAVPSSNPDKPPTLTRWNSVHNGSIKSRKRKICRRRKFYKV